MKKYDKIIKSTRPPKETNVLWIDVSGAVPITKVFNNGQWEPVKSPDEGEYMSNTYLDNEGILIIERGDDGSTSVYDGNEHPILRRDPDGTTKYFDSNKTSRLVISPFGDITFAELSYVQEQLKKDETLCKETRILVDLHDDELSNHLSRIQNIELEATNTERIPDRIIHEITGYITTKEINYV